MDSRKEGTRERVREWVDDKTPPPKKSYNENRGDNHLGRWCRAKIARETKNNTLEIKKKKAGARAILCQIQKTIARGVKDFVVVGGKGGMREEGMVTWDGDIKPKQHVRIERRKG